MTHAKSILSGVKQQQLSYVYLNFFFPTTFLNIFFPYFYYGALAYKNAFSSIFLKILSLIKRRDVFSALCTVKNLLCSSNFFLISISDASAAGLT